MRECKDEIPDEQMHRRQDANPLHIKTAVPTGVGTGHVYIVDGIVVDGVAEYVDLARDVGLTAS